MKRFKSKKGLALLATLIVIAAAAIGAYAYFTSTGSGTGSGGTATPASLTIKQIGAGYDTLIPSDSYIQDQCFNCAQISELGNKIKLQHSGLQRLADAVVAFRNWGPAFSDVPITLSIVGGPTSTVTPSIAAAQPSGRPTVTNVTFPFTGGFVSDEFVYKISFDASGHANALNVALSSSANDMPVGSNSNPGTIWVNTAAGPGIDGDFPSCTVPGSGFAQVNTACGPSAGGNPGAYGNGVGTTSADADVPAVEFNVVGGSIVGLAPGDPAQPVEFAIINPGPATVFVNQIATTLGTATGGQDNASCNANLSSWYAVAGSPDAVGVSVPSGTKIVSPTTTTLRMVESGTNQNACAGASIGLSFAAS